jgi:hypothetical protein
MDGIRERRQAIVMVKGKNISTTSMMMQMSQSLARQLVTLECYIIKEAASITRPPSPSIPAHHSAQFETPLLDEAFASKDL